MCTNSKKYVRLALSICALVYVVIDLRGTATTLYTTRTFTNTNASHLALLRNASVR